MTNCQLYKDLRTNAMARCHDQQRQVCPADNTCGPMMSLRHNTRRGFRAAIASILLVWSSSPAASEDRPLEAPVVDWSHVLHAHRLAESWVSATEVPQTAGSQAIPVSRLIGVRVTLRWAGRVMGQGQYDTPGTADHLGHDLVEAVRSATDDALKEAAVALRSRQADATARRPQVSKRMSLAHFAQRLRVDLQVGYRLQPLGLPDSATEHGLLRAFAPGHHGLLASRRNDAGELAKSWMWPASALAMNLRPRGQVRQLLAKLGYRHDALERLGQIDDLSWSRFQVIHVVRPAADLPVARLVRGNEPLQHRALTGRDLDGAARLMAEYLLDRQLVDGAFAGTFIPATHTFRPATASDRQTAVAIYALMRREALHGVTNAVDRTALRQAVRRGALNLARVLTDQAQPNEPAATALLIMTLIEADFLTDLKPHRDELASRLVALENSDGSFRNADGSSAGRVGPSTQALCAAALVSLYGQTREKSLLSAIHRARTWFWLTTDRAALAYTLPWSSVVELQMDRVSPSDDAVHRRQFEASLPALVALRKAILTKQVVVVPTMGPADVVGGFDLTGTNDDQAPAPDWRSASLLAFLAASMRHQTLGVAENRIDDLLACGLAARFMAQLMFDEPSCFFAIDRNTMVGGVRSAFWDNRLPLDRTAMGLLAMTELQETLVYLASKHRRK